MHELSIAIALVDLASDVAADLGAQRVTAVHVAIGPLAGVVEEALTFSFDIAASGTVADGAVLRIRTVPLVVFCTNCAAERQLESPQHLRCPICGQPTPDVRSGRDLHLVGVEVPDVPDCRTASAHPEEERPARG